ncbi:hypothetical protein QAD02_009749 [Eretmocerus hayati]|uniref:Uncharacterized protein n=1 Tax=Eretmocerus hayati TaxID=131215 RepID=A0ACC2NB07_9HYME|nr:hypothetical protein QAD02_009749 [Eretmocerus hayati]
MSKIQCKVSPNRFCYVCGTLTFKGEIRDMTPSFMSLYHHYFKRDVRDQDKCYVPKGVCASCNTTLRAWSNGARKSMPFGSPMIWTRPSNLPEDCYFCNCLTEGYNCHNHKLIEYPDHTSSQRPRPHNSDLPIPPAPWIQREDDCEDSDSGNGTIDFVDPVEDSDLAPRTPKLYDQESLNDLVRDLGLTKADAELLGSRLQERNMLALGTCFSQYRYRDKDFTEFFKEEDSLVYCDNVPGLMAAFGLLLTREDREKRASTICLMACEELGEGKFGRTSFNANRLSSGPPTLSDEGTNYVDSS